MKKNNYVFVVGNSDYLNDQKFPQIKHCVNDAKVIFNELCEEEGIFDKRKSKLLLNSSYSTFSSELNNFLEQIEVGSFVLFYFSGHGEVVKGKNYYLVMNDSGYEGKLIASSAFNIENLSSFFLEKGINSYVVILDSCRSGKALRTSGVRNRNSSVDTIIQHVSEEISGDGKIFISSSKHYQTSKELDELSHGLFSYYFIDALRNGILNINNNYYIDIRSIYEYVFSVIQLKHKEHNQTPVFSGNEIVGKIYIAKNKAFSQEANQENDSESTEIERKLLIENTDSEKSIKISKVKIKSAERRLQKSTKLYLSFRMHLVLFREAILVFTGFIGLIITTISAIILIRLDYNQYLTIAVIIGGSLLVVNIIKDVSFKSLTGSKTIIKLKWIVDNFYADQRRLNKIISKNRAHMFKIKDSIVDLNRQKVDSKRIFEKSEKMDKGLWIYDRRTELYDDKINILQHEYDILEKYYSLSSEIYTQTSQYNEYIKEAINIFSIGEFVKRKSKSLDSLTSLKTVSKNSFHLLHDFSIIRRLFEELDKIEYEYSSDFLDELSENYLSEIHTFRKLKNSLNTAPKPLS